MNGWIGDPGSSGLGRVDKRVNMMVHIHLGEVIDRFLNFGHEELHFGPKINQFLMTNLQKFAVRVEKGYFTLEGPIIQL